MPIEFASPKGLLLLGLLAPIVLLYLLKVRRERRVVSSIWLWQTAERDLIAKNPFRRLTPRVSLILQCLAVIALALALGEPTARSEGASGDAVAIVIDVSGSMAALEPDGKTRLAHAKTHALDVVDGLPANTEVLVVAAGAEPQVVSALDRDRRRVEAAIAALGTRDEEARFERAIALASDRVASLSRDGRLVLLTDAPLDVGESTRLPIDTVVVGTATDNVSIVRIDARRAVDPSTRRERVDTFLAVVNHGRADAERFVTLRQRNSEQPLASRRIHVAAGERAFVVLSFAPAKSDTGTGLVAELSPHDALATDDRAQTTVPAGRRLPVVVASDDGAPWLERALQSDPEVELFRTTADELASTPLPAGALVVADGFCPDAPLDGDLLVVDPPPGPCLSTTIGKTVRSPIVTSWADQDARLQFLTLGDVSIRSSHSVEGASAASRLVRAGDAVLVADASVPDRHVTIVAFDVAESNWPLKTSFVVFVRNVAELARVSHERQEAQTALTGKPLRIVLPPGVDTVTLEDPDGSSQEVSVRDGLALAPPPGRAGFYYAHWQLPAPGSRLIAVNLESDTEGDLRPTERSVRDHDRAGARAPIARVTRFAWLAAIAGLCLLLADVWWATRAGNDRARSRNRAGTT